MLSGIFICLDFIGFAFQDMTESLYVTAISLISEGVFGERRLEIPVRISYADDPEEAADIIIKTITTIKRALESADILIPFPIRTLDFGAKGGTTLTHALEMRSSNDNQ